MAGFQDRFEQWEESYRTSPLSLSIVRLLFGTLLLALMLPRFQWVALFPQSFFHPPPGPASLFGGFPARAYFLTVDATLITAAVFLIAGRYVTVASLFIVAGLLAGDIWAYSFGKIDHDILLVLLPAFLAVAGWDGQRPGRAWPLALFALVVSVAMAMSAWQKAASGWLSPSAYAVLGHSVWFAVQDAPSASWNLAIRLLPSAGWKAMDYVTVGFEAAFLVAVVRAAAFRGVCAFACFFHVVVAMLMRITFVSNIPAYAVFVHWEDVAARAGVRDAVERLERQLAAIGTVPLAVASSVLCAIYLRWGSPIRIMSRLLGPEHEIVPRAVAICASAILAAIVVVMRVRGRRAARGLR